MARLKPRIEQLERVFEGEARAAKWRVSQVLMMMSRAEKVLMLDGFSAEFRGEPYPEGFDQVMEKFEGFGGAEALQRLKLFENEEDRARAAEFRNRVVAGKNRRTISRR